MMRRVSELLALLLISSLTIPLPQLIATEGQITEVRIAESPIDNRTMRITLEAYVRVSFTKPGEYKIRLLNPEGGVSGESFTFKLGSVSSSMSWLFEFNLSLNPGIYPYTVVLLVREETTAWWEADRYAVVFRIPPPVTETRTINSTANCTTYVTGGVILKTLTFTRNVTITNTTTVTIPVTKYLELWNTTTLSVTETMILTRNATVTLVTTVVGIAGMEMKSLDPIYAAILLSAVIVLMALLVRRLRSSGGTERV